MSRIAPITYVALLLAETIALTTLYATEPPAPSDPLSIWLGTFGLGSMIVMLLYSVARRVASLRRIMRLSSWLNLHIFLGLQGFVLIFFHSLPMFSSAHFQWLNPGVINFFGVCVIICSGVFGRWMFQHVPKTLGGRLMAAKDVDKELATLNAELPNEVRALWTGLPQARSLGELFAADRDLRAAKRTLAAIDLPPEIRALAERRLLLERQRAALSVTQRIFRFWIIAHRPLAAIVYVLSAVHLLLALMFTPSLRFF